MIGLRAGGWCAAALAAGGGVGALAAADAPALADAPAPVVSQLVVLPGSSAPTQRSVKAATTSVRVERRRCAVAGGTALASLLRSRSGRVGLADYGACSERARDGGGLYVRSIAGRRARGLSGWVYKVDRKLATAGAGDPAGPFGRGRLRARQRVTWFYCRLRKGSCQRTLEVQPRTGDAGGLSVIVRGFDDEGRGIAVPGATVSAGGARSVTDAAGRATLALAPGSYRVRAEKAGLVASFRERVIVP